MYKIYFASKGQYIYPIRNNFSKRCRFDVENKNQKFFEISIDFNGFLVRRNFD